MDGSPQPRRRESPLQTMVPSRSPRHRHLIFVMEELISRRMGWIGHMSHFTGEIGALLCSPTFTREADLDKDEGY
jgi:hypothetical protein